MQIKIHSKDQMTPIERIRAIEAGDDYDRLLCTPFIGNMRLLFLGVSEEEYMNSAKLMAEGEILAFNRFGFDRLGIGPNTKGISAALEKTIEKDMSKKPVIDDYSKLDGMEPADAFSNKDLEIYMNAAEILSEKAGHIVPIEASIGGPFTIASFLRGVERLLADCRKRPEEIHRLLRIVVDSQKSCVDKLAEYGVGIAMADPVASPVLIGPRYYSKFVYDYTKELTDYIYEKTGKKASLHMCGDTRLIWKYLSQYQINEISLDNVVDLEKAAIELGEYVPIAGNVDPVEIMLRGTREDIFESVRSCIEKGTKAKKGFHLTTGCDIPDGTAIEKADWFMEAARKYGAHKS